MSGINSKLVELRRQAYANEVEVEDLIDFAVRGDTQAVPIINDLRREFDWPRENDRDGSHVVPLGRWAEVVCTYLEGGFKALIEYALLPDGDSIYFATSVMSDLKTPDCAKALADLSERLHGFEFNEPRAPFNLAHAINLVLSFKDAPSLAAQDAERLRNFLHRCLQQSVTESDQALVICALRGVGDDQSISNILALPQLVPPYADLQSSACKAIRKKQRRS